MNIEITKNVTKKHLADIKHWLADEDARTGQGFYCNWNIIEGSFNNGEMYCAIDQGAVVGFLIFNTSKFSANIDIMEIHDNYRRKGIGKQLVDAFLGDLRATGIVVVDLESRPITSLPFWMSFGFLPVGGGGELYLPLFGPCCDASPELNDEIIEIYATNYYDHVESKPVNNLKIERHSSGRITRPIVIPYYADVRIRWKKGNHIQYDGRMKGFPGRVNGCKLFIVTALDSLSIDS